jgi:precorrin-2/cobalt-factor-2 C20-methyltransferase
MSSLGIFYGIGVGPGEPGLIPVAALEALRNCELIFAPRAQSMDFSVARSCLKELGIPEERFKEVEFTMDPNRSVLKEHYRDLGEKIAKELKTGKNVAYLTIGDSLTYSTYSYTLSAVLDLVPDVEHRTFPGITSYSAVAAANDWPLGEGKERVLILPCPESEEELKEAIRQNDIVVLMKIGERLPKVLKTLRELEIAEHCAFGKRIGMSDQIVCSDLRKLNGEESLGYLSTMLIRKTQREKRHK